MLFICYLDLMPLGMSFFSAECELDKQMTTSEAISQPPQTIDAQLKEVFAHFPETILVLVFGSVALKRQRADSDLDIAVAAEHALTAHEKIALIGALAASTGRPIDLIDLKAVSEPLLGQIVRYGRRVLGSDTL
jgi:predicted nucleotidyltransferase